MDHSEHDANLGLYRTLVEIVERPSLAQVLSDDVLDILLEHSTLELLP